jgi:hypothetical protein
MYNVFRSGVNIIVGCVCNLLSRHVIFMLIVVMVNTYRLTKAYLISVQIIVHKFLFTIKDILELCPTVYSRLWYLRISSRHIRPCHCLFSLFIYFPILILVSLTRLKKSFFRTTRDKMAHLWFADPGASSQLWFTSFCELMQLHFKSKAKQHNLNIINRAIVLSTINHSGSLFLVIKSLMNCFQANTSHRLNYHLNSKL